jgi:hypothetical protein
MRDIPGFVKTQLVNDTILRFFPLKNRAVGRDWSILAALFEKCILRGHHPPGFSDRGKTHTNFLRVLLSEMPLPEPPMALFSPD